MRILQFILCLPIWGILIPALASVMDRICDAIENASDSALYRWVVYPVAGVIVWVAVPVLFLVVGLAVWVGVGLLLGIDM